jgi:outer membrane protein
MKISITKILVFAVLFVASVQMQAQKFGYINSQELIQNMVEVKEANANIETYKTQLQKKGEEMIKKLQTKYQALEAKRNNGELSPKQLEVEAQSLKGEEVKIAQFEQESQQKIIDKSETVLKPIRDKIQNAINEVAAESGYQYIFDASLGIILYADDATDVSSLVKSKLGL